MKCEIDGNKIIFYEINISDLKEMQKTILKYLSINDLVLDLSSMDKLPTQIMQIILSAHVKHGAELKISSNLTKEFKNYGIQMSKSQLPSPSQQNEKIIHRV